MFRVVTGIYFFFCYCWILFTSSVSFFYLYSLYFRVGFLYEVQNKFLGMLRDCLVEGGISPISAVTFPIPQDSRGEPSLSAAPFQIHNHLWATELEVKEMQGRRSRLQEMRKLSNAPGMLICMSSLCCCKEVQLFFCTFPKIQHYWSLQLVQSVGKGSVGFRSVCLSASSEAWLLSCSEMSPGSAKLCVISVLPNTSLLS